MKIKVSKNLTSQCINIHIILNVVLPSTRICLFAVINATIWLLCKYSHYFKCGASINLNMSVCCNKWYNMATAQGRKQWLKIMHHHIYYNRPYCSFQSYLTRCNIFDLSRDSIEQLFRTWKLKWVLKNRNDTFSRARFPVI